MEWKMLKTVHYRVPVGAPAGALSFTVSDGGLSNALDYQQMAADAYRRVPTQLVSFLNNLRPNTNAYVRVWRTDPAFQVQGQDLPDPPPSVGLILAQGASRARRRGFRAAPKSTNCRSRPATLW